VVNMVEFKNIWDIPKDEYDPTDEIIAYFL